ncbi:YchJ family protein [Nocardioides sp. InS609-2]|uniref:YchJ family protein n=1 Tax=Nocardioides sp. InS609-2 TaxID=2760705 RepID=UPI0020BF9ADD|nr:YchJ family protein [Nocardioides sp. InS609-2]
MNAPLSWPCPCGTGLAYDACCGRLHRGAAQAETAEELMRSRYAAYALRNEDHVFRTWHPRTRPDRIDLEPATTWTGLRILDTEAGGVDDESGVVEFAAAWTHAGKPGVLRERSRFERRAGRWVYVDGDVIRG